MNHVSGHVRSTSGEPIEAADVLFYGVTRKTDGDGCFHFGGVLAASGFRIEVHKAGFKPYSEARKFNLYDVEVVLDRLDDAVRAVGEGGEGMRG